MRRRRWLVGLALLAVTAGTAVGIDSIANSTRPAAESNGKGAVATTSACGITAAGIRILQNGQTVYREPGHVVHPNGGPPAQVRCSGGSIWVVWPFQGAGMSQEAYFGVHSGDGGRTWHPVFTEPFFGRKAPHAFDAYLGPWTLRGPRDAYFVGTCPACSVGLLQGTVSLWVTKDGGGTFREYKVPTLTGYEPTRLRVARGAATIDAKGFEHNVAKHKAATVRVG